jgi:hypothetical protein
MISNVSSASSASQVSQQQKNAPAKKPQGEQKPEKQDTVVLSKQAQAAQAHKNSGR